MITLFFAGFLSFIYFIISRSVIRVRRKNQVSIGYGHKDSVLPNYVSAHANFAAYTPMFIILLFLLENSGQAPRLFLLVLAILFSAGRILHFLGLTKMEPLPKPNFKFRVAGMILTLVPMTLLAVSAMIISLTALRF